MKDNVALVQYSEIIKSYTYAILSYLIARADYYNSVYENFSKDDLKNEISKTFREEFKRRGIDHFTFDDIFPIFEKRIDINVASLHSDVDVFAATELAKDTFAPGILSLARYNHEKDLRLSDEKIVEIYDMSLMILHRSIILFIARGVTGDYTVDKLIRDYKSVYRQLLGDFAEYCLYSEISLKKKIFELTRMYSGRFVHYGTSKENPKRKTLNIVPHYKEHPLYYLYSGLLAKNEVIFEVLHRDEFRFDAFWSGLDSSKLWDLDELIELENSSKHGAD